ncbi:MAG: ATP-binding protein [Syntrophomonadaceae bacterium]|nr:ATP-binding protein [Syntrophomonadaceae bacterium]
MQKVFFIIGARASGKTYYINHHFADKDVEILDIYDYQQRAYDEAGFRKEIPIETKFRCMKKANEMHLHDIIEKLKQGKNVVAEQTFYKAKRRIAYIDEIRKAVDVEIEVYVMYPSDEQWKDNIQKTELKSGFKAFKQEVSGLVFPNPAEGFDNIFTVTDGVITRRTDPADVSILAEAREEREKEDEQIIKEDEAYRKRKALLESMNNRPFWHYCEVCEKKEYITAQEAFHRGWDYPPQMGSFGLLSQRKCGECGIADTLWWKIQTSGKLPIVVESELTDTELMTWKRIKGEPESLLNEEAE